MDKDKIDNYREAIARELMTLYHGGDNSLTEAEALKNTAVLTDEELADGIEWNTPEDVARLLLESGLM